MKNRLIQTVLVASLTTFVGTAYAAHGYDNTRTRAKVLSSAPVTETVNEPRRECWTETTGYDNRRVEDNSTGGAVLGAIAGGLLGSTVGKGNGRVAAAAVGAATGAVVGGRLGSGERYESQPRQVERCRTHDNFRDVVVGYDVRYRFEGREYTTRLPYQPGKWINLDVSHRVADDQRDDGRVYGRNDWDN
jgi:uncharacterized protein YcfJ